MYGQVFRNLRQQQNISQRSACQGICSESNLSRWENGQIELDFDKVIELLDHIHVTGPEFINAFTPTPSRADDFDKISDSNNPNLIKTAAFKQLELFHSTKNPNYLLNSLFLFNQIKILTNKNYYPEIDQIKLVHQLSNITIWTQYYLNIFGASIFLIRPKMIYGLGMHIISNMKNDNYLTNNNLITALGSLGDAILAQILAHDLDHAQKMLNAIKKIDIPFYLMFFSVTWNYLQKLINYSKDNDEQSVLKVIDDLVKLNCSAQANIYMDMFNKLKGEIIKNKKASRK